jgi:predicted metalloprotease with PDZ domain
MGIVLPVGVHRSRSVVLCAIASALFCDEIARAEAVQPAQQPLVRYTLEYRPHDGGSSFAVQLHTDCDPLARDVGLYLLDWGEWAEVDSLYLRGFRSDPPARRHPDSPERWIIDVPEGWDGSLDVSYTIPLIDLDSHAAQRHGLLPWEVRRAGAPPYAAATSRNTLMLVTVGGEIVAPVEVTLAAPPEYTVASGWGGVSGATQTCTADLTEESPLLFGVSPKHAARDAAGVPCEVVQLSAGPDVTGQLLDQAASLADAYARSTGLPLERPLRVFVTDKGGGQRVDRGLWMQAASDGWESSPYYKHLMAHELFHDWLGGMAKPADESTVWFLEGFTDYLSLWHMVATGQASPEWFAQRIGELNEEARASAAYGQAAFGDPSVSWRDWDGPNETLAYKGGAVLAFALDAELRSAGGPRLPIMIADLARAGEPYTLDSIRQWLEAHGMAEFYAAHIAAPGLPDWRPLVESAGFAIVERDAPLAYLGLRSDGGTYLGEILAIDPEGPAAALGLNVGERITGLWPSRNPRPQIGPGVTTEYRFGLDLASGDAEQVNLGVLGPAGERTVQLSPRPISGGRFTVVEPGEHATEFFRLPD